MAHQHVVSEYMEHGACFLWEPGLVWLHVIFDFDGLIADAEPLHCKAFRKVLDPPGVRFT